MKVLELYSGIGGMHMALKESQIQGNVVASIEINNVANEIYKLNFPHTPLFNMNIEGLSAEFINNLDVDTILMSPPCQPFTRNGLQKDIRDPRTTSFLHILEILPHMNIENILIENVKGFEKSDTRNILMQALEKGGFSFQEFIVSPDQIAIPNSRHRYYCLAKKLPNRFSFKTGSLMEHFPIQLQNNECFCLTEILENIADKKFFLSDSILKKYVNVLDICHTSSRRSCCFTKAYGRFLEGTGSVLTDRSEEEVPKILSEAMLQNTDENLRIELLKSLNLRFFTPREVCRLMCFPESFKFSPNLSDRKKYMLLGNSINVRVVSELIKLLNS
ncbi:unnamed protein product [Phaedon cochleariae]|uniref:tRNA (Cytosine(38)-C(5))-methyltransferase n=1 Tax=Phaedon cochleariae TaxID=80249 RepID=A0A9P0DUD3_PHACE|nr:unnamed protein product [Phaedon cochleariae]